MVPLTHATSEGSDEPAHPHSLATGINAHIQGCRCRCKSKAFLPNSARNFFVCKQQRRRSARAPAQIYQLSLESMIAKPATCKKIKFLSDMRARIQTIPTGGGGGGGGGGSRIASRGRFVPIFLLGNKWLLMIFMGRPGPPALSVSAHIRVSNSFNSHFI